jgi:hypothetical protein
MKSITSFLSSSAEMLILTLCFSSISYVGFSQLSGDYTVDPGGGSFPNFVTIKAAVDSLHAQGVSGTVVFNIADGTYNEKIQINQISGASASNRITFQSESLDSTKVIMTSQADTWSDDNWTLRLNGTDYMTIRKMKLQASGSYYARVIDINGYAHHNIIENCQFWNPADAYDAELIYSVNDQAEFNTIRNNYFINGSRGIRMEGVAYHTLSSGTQIYNNNFIDQKSLAIYLIYHNAPSVYSNSFTLTQSGSKGIYLNTCDNEIEITNNIINCSNNSSGGIELQGCDGDAGRKGLIKNNFVRIGGFKDNAVGIKVDECKHINVFHNSVNITSTFTGIGSGAFMQRDVDCSDIDVRNNVFANTGGGYAYNIGNPSTILNSDNNDYYATGEFLAWWGGEVTDFQALQEASEMDDNSVSVNPRFQSETDLHTSTYWLDGLGASDLGISFDIDGDVRSSPPDIGADEFDPTRFPLAEGTYKIGGATPDYLMIKEAFDDLQLVGILGPVTFEIRNGEYDEYIGEVGPIPGANATDTIVFKSESGNPADVVIHYSTDETNYRNIFHFKGLDHFTLMDVTVSATGDNFGSTLNFNGNCENINIINNILASANTIDAVLGFSGGVINDISIKNNSFSKGGRGIYFYGASDNFATNTVIENNKSTGALTDGINLRYHLSPHINNNTISTGVNPGFAGIRLRDCEKDLEVIGNKIDIESGDYGMRLHNCNAVLPFKGLVANNMIQIGGTGNTFALCILFCKRQDYFYNSLNVSSTESVNGKGIYIVNENEELNIKNNISANTGGGYAIWVEDPSDISMSDFNGFYSTGTNLAHWGGTDYLFLSAFSGISGMDKHSLETEPIFYSDNGLYSTQALFHKAATPVSEVEYDIDGIARDASTPDIGASEFSCVEPTFNVYVSPACFGDTTMIIDSTENIAPGSSRGWDMNGDMTIDIYTENQYDTIMWVFDEPGNNSIGYILMQIAGCNSYETFDAAVIPEPELLIDSKGAYCDSTDGWAEVSVTNMEGPFRYAWSNRSTESRIENLVMGTYSITVRHQAAGCSASGEVTIGEAIEIEVTAMSPSTCGKADGSATVKATGGFEPYDYYWSDMSANEIDQTNDINDGLAPGPHYVTAVDRKGCKAKEIIFIESTDGPQVNFVGSVNNDCFGETNGSLDIDISGGVAPYKISWSNGDTSEDIANLAAGYYNVEVTDAEECVGAGSFQIGQKSQISISTLITAANCEEADGSAIAIVSGGTRPYNYEWSTGGHFEIENGLAAGVYSLSVLDAKGCEMLEPVFVDDIGAPIVTIEEVNGVGCTVSDNGSISISASPPNPFYTYSWSSGQSTPSINNLTVGTYDITVADENGCEGVSQAVIQQEPPEPTPICIVSVDTLTGKNTILWKKENTEEISHYNIYREGTDIGDYRLIDTVNVNSESIYTDRFADPMIRSWKYKMSAVDVCGIESELSPNHKTIHLTMGVGLNETVNLIWDKYEGFLVSSYKIWRYDDNTLWTNITNLPSNTDAFSSYTDVNPPQENLTFFVEVQHPAGCISTEKKPTRLNSSRSNRRSSKKSAIVPGIFEELINISELSIYPNPGKGIFNLDIELLGLSELNIKVFDISGKMLSAKEYSNVRGRLETEVDLSGYTDGMYQVQIVVGNVILHRLLIKEQK